jgi:hypothetical protein
MSFQSVKTSAIAKAFALAHYYSEVAASNEDRLRFRKVARLIWDALGEETAMPHILPENLKALVPAEPLLVGRETRHEATAPTEAK